jgi:hypothetical protein
MQPTIHRIVDAKQTELGKLADVDRPPEVTMAYSEQALLNQCHPVFKPRLEAILIGLRQKGWKPRIAELVRTSEQQKKKVAAGVSKTLKSWHVPSTIGLLANGASALDIVHGNAADIVDERYGWSGLAASHSFKFWKDLGQLARENNCEWGGDWKKFPDPAHVQCLFVESPALRTTVV